MALRVPGKYRARKTTVDGIKFHSKRESDHYLTLKLRQKAGEIRQLQPQPRYPLFCGGRPVRYATGRQAEYRADFLYFQVDPGVWVIEDVKGYDEPLGKLKRAVFEAESGRKVIVVR